MFTRASALWLTLGVLFGYALAGSSARVEAQPNAAPPFLSRGDELTLIVLQDKTEHGACTIAALESGWIRCESRDRFASRPLQEWWNLNYALRIQKRAQQ